MNGINNISHIVRGTSTGAAVASTPIQNGSNVYFGILNAKDYLASGSIQTTTGTVTAGSTVLTVASAIDFAVGQGIRIATGVQVGAKEVVTLQVTAGVTTLGTITVWLNGLNYPIAVTAGQTAIQVADAIRAAASDTTKFRQYVTSGTTGTDTIVFTAKTPATKFTAPTFNGSTTGVTATISVTTIGVPRKDHVAKISAIVGTQITLDVACPLAVTNLNIHHDDRSAIQDAVDAAITAKKPLFIPTGTYNVYFKDTGVVFDANNPQRTLTIDATAGELTVYGAGSGMTKIQVGPEAPSHIYCGFTHSARYNYEFRDFSLVGPTDTNDGDLDLMSGTNAIFSQPYNLASEASAVITFRNLYLSNFVQSVNVSSNDVLNSTGVVTYTFHSCKIRAYSVAVAVFRHTTNVVCRKRFHAYNCDFSSGTPEGRGNILYIHPHVSMIVDSCILHDNWRAGVHHHSDTASYNYSPPAEYAVIQKCHFYNITALTIITSNNVPTEISECTFRNSYGIAIRSSATISNCDFDGKKPDNATYQFLGYYNNKLPPTAEIYIKGCRVNGGLGLGKFNYHISDCVLQTASTTGNGGMIDIEASTPRVELFHCRLTNSLANVGFESPIAIGVGGGNKVVVRDCVFDGKFVSGVFVGTGGAAAAASDILFSNNSVETDSLTKFVQYLGDTAHQIRGAGNRWTTVPFTYWFDSSGTRALLVQDMTIGPGFAPTAIASAASIIIGPNYDLYHVSGTTTIDNIIVGKSTTDDDTKLFGGSTLRLIVDAAWAFSTAGNIIPLNVNAQVVGAVITLIYDQVSLKWRQV